MFKGARYIIIYLEGLNPSNFGKYGVSEVIVMTVEERLTRLETIIENQTKQINKLNNSVESLVEKFEQRIEINGRQDVNIATMKTKHEELEKKVEDQGEELESLAREVRGDIKLLTRKVYMLVGILTGAQSLLTLLLKFFG